MRKIACIFLPYFLTALVSGRDGWARPPLVVYRDTWVAGVSPELKDQGLVGLPLAQARGRFPEACFVAWDETLYQQARDQYLQVLTGFSPLIEPVNEEECFFDLTGSDTRVEMAELARCLRGKGWGPVLVGVGRNKFLARLAAHARLETKSAITEGFWLTEVPAGKEREFLSGLPLAMDWLLSSRVRESLTAMGFRYFSDVQQLSLAALEKLLGRDGHVVYRHSRGLDNTPLLNLYPPGTIAFSLGFEGGSDRREDLLQALKQAAHLLASILHRRRKGCRSVTLKITGEKDADQAERLIPWGCRAEGQLREVLGNLLNRLVITGPVTGMTVEASSLYDWQFTEPDLFAGDWREPVKQDLSSITRALNEKFPGAVHPQPGVDRREEILSLWDPWRCPDKTRRSE